MKKLSLLIALCMLISIGGVYAVWTYPGAEVSPINRDLSIGVTSATAEGAAGYLELVSNAIDVKINPKVDKDDYTAVMNWEGEIVVKFVHNEGFDDSVLDTLKLFITIQNNQKYNGVDIYKLTTDTIDLTWNLHTSGQYYEARIPYQMLEAVLTLGDDFVLNSYAEHEAFSELEQDISINLLVGQSPAVSNKQ